MKRSGLKPCRLALLVNMLLWCTPTGAQTPGRELHWDALDVEARLNGDGILDVVERHAMVFTGDWNGGERVFDVRPRQKLEFLGLERMDARTGSLHSLQEASVPNDVDEFTWSDRRTLRWRSRLPSDPLFANTRLTYVLRYRLSGVLLKEDSQYLLDHDFAFPKRPGPIVRFTLKLDFDPAWQPPGDSQNQYTAGPLESGQSFVLKIPLGYSASDEPAAIDTQRPTEIVAAVTVILGGLALLLLIFLQRERSLGRFAPVDTTGVDSAWIENHILSHPAEVVGATWDGRVSTSEVVALIARMTAEGKLESMVEAEDSMRLRLKVGREELRAHERSLVDGLFFSQRTETSTKEIQLHYKGRGFDPATVIRPELQKLVAKVLPSGRERVGRLAGLTLFAAGAVLLLWTAFSDPVSAGAAIAIGIFSLILGSILQIPGWLFRSRPDWGPTAATLLLLPAVFVSAGIAAFLWLYAGTGADDAVLKAALAAADSRRERLERPA